jgi:hypothetical protein
MVENHFRRLTDKTFNKESIKPCIAISPNIHFINSPKSFIEILIFGVVVFPFLLLLPCFYFLPCSYVIDWLDGRFKHLLFFP